ncbi:hypothetical protein SAM19_02434 [Brevibacillus laterosporus]|nr:hypothetical protein [Brevibacillus laterosporus]
MPTPVGFYTLALTIIKQRINMSINKQTNGEFIYGYFS